MVALSTLLLVAAPATPAAGQQGVSRELLQRVLPGADRFGERDGDPPVVRGWTTDPSGGGETLVGFAFLTSDVPPEELGYNGPIDVLVGMDPSGTITGIVVVDYYESLRGSRGDFLARRGFQEQFTGKTISDAFRVRRDVDGISGATITVAAMSRGIRNAARRVWTVHVLADAGAEPGEGAPPPPVPDADALRRLSWLEMASRDMLQKMIIQDGGVTRIELTLLRVKDEAAGHVLLGRSAYERAMEEAGDRAEGRHVWMLGVDGALTALFRSQALFVVQDGDTVKMGGNAVMIGEPRSGKADAQFRNAGLLFVDGAVDARRPFTFVLDLNNGWGAFTADHPGEPRPVVASEGAGPSSAVPSGEEAGPPGDAAGTEEAAGPPGDAAAGAPLPENAPADPSPGADEGAAPASPGEAGATAAPRASDEDAAAMPPDARDEDRAATRDGDPATPPPGTRPDLPFQLAGESDETVLSRTLDRTSWPRFAALGALLVLVSIAFATKRSLWLRPLALVATVVVLGLGGGFLSVSHLVAALKVGPGVFLEDLPLLLLVMFTVVTTLLWGRVFCGYLCPFGALQDALERVVPARFRRALPRAVHEKGLLAKYGVLALVLLPAAAGSQATIFQYVEPFGTVFFLSSSVLLWGIAAAILVASAVIPRFYCRYACPLGASLALASVLSPFRIRRVEQCTVCTVCERACPTGAIRRERVDFKECVRCNLCEKALEFRVGVCRHDMAEVRQRLVQIEVGAAGGSTGGR